MPKKNSSSELPGGRQSPTWVGMMSARLLEVYISAEKIHAGSVPASQMHAAQSHLDMGLVVSAGQGSVQSAGRDDEIVVVQGLRIVRDVDLPYVNVCMTLPGHSQQSRYDVNSRIA